MELLLNLAWLLLALPAFWLWRAARTTPKTRRFSAFQCLLALGCLLVLLFPVISATDDLRAMRAEMEESPNSKRSIGQSSGENPTASPSPIQPPLAVRSHTAALHQQGWYFVVAMLVSTPASPALLRAVRGPPHFFLG